MFKNLPSLKLRPTTFPASEFHQICTRKIQQKKASCFWTQLTWPNTWKLFTKSDSVAYIAPKDSAPSGICCNTWTRFMKNWNWTNAIFMTKSLDSLQIFQCMSKMFTYCLPPPPPTIAKNNSWCTKLMVNFFFVGMPYNWSFYHPQSHWTGVGGYTVVLLLYDLCLWPHLF